jgi:hypothetical protein
MFQNQILRMHVCKASNPRLQIRGFWEFFSPKNGMVFEQNINFSLFYQNLIENPCGQQTKKSDFHMATVKSITYQI